MGLDTNPNAAALLGGSVSLLYAGGFCGATSCWFIADRFGRRFAIAMASTIVLISGALVAGSVNMGMFMAFRFFTGWGCLMYAIAVPLWIAEISPQNSRGILASMHAVMSGTGYTVSAYVGVGFYYYTPGSGTEWRPPLALVCVWPLINLAVMAFLPESPRYLITKDKDDAALAILQKVHKSKDDPEHEFAKAEFYQIKMQEHLDRTLSTSWGEVLKRPSYRKRMLIAMSLTVFINSCGDLVITNFATTIIADLGFNPAQSLEFTAGIGPVSLFGVFLSLLYVDRIPRNVMISVGLFIAAALSCCQAAITAQFLGTTNRAGLAASVAIMFLFIFNYNLFLEGPSWWYNAEIFPTHLRAKGMAVGISVFCLSNILWLQLAPTAFANIGWKFYLVFICITFVASLTVFFVYPDTANKPLEEVARLFGDDDLVAIYQQDIVIDHYRHEIAGIKGHAVEKEVAAETEPEI